MHGNSIDSCNIVFCHKCADIGIYTVEKRNCEMASVMYPVNVLQKSSTAGFAFEPLSIVVNAGDAALSLWDMHGPGRLGSVFFDHFGATAAGGIMHNMFDVHIETGLSVF